MKEGNSTPTNIKKCIIVKVQCDCQRMEACGLAVLVFCAFVCHCAALYKSSGILNYSPTHSLTYSPNHQGTHAGRVLLSEAVYSKELRHLSLQEVVRTHYPDTNVDAAVVRLFIGKQDINRVMQAILLMATEGEANPFHKNEIISSLILLLLKIQTKSYSHYKNSLLMNMNTFQNPWVLATINSILCFIDQKPFKSKLITRKEEFYDTIIRQLPYENAVKLVIAQHQHRDNTETSLLDSVALLDAMMLDTRVFYHYYRSIYTNEVSNEYLFASGVLDYIHGALLRDTDCPEFELIHFYLLGNAGSHDRNSYIASLGGLRRYSSWKIHNKIPLFLRIIHQNTDTQPNLLLSSLSDGCSSNTTTIVVVGDGDFSFSASLLTAWPTATLPSVLTTTISAEHEFATKYVNASANIQRIVAHQSARILYNIDVTTAVPTVTSDTALYLFNFPYADTRQVDTFDTVWMRSGRHIDLLVKFLRNIVIAGSSSKKRVYITLTGDQIHSWRLGSVLRDVKYELVDAFPFNATVWNGYERTRSNVNSRFPLESAWTLVLQPRLTDSR